jgi:putative glutamine amidotransferase
MKLLFFLLFIPCLGWSQSIILISKDKNQEIKNWVHRIDSNWITVECFGLPNDSLQFYLSRAKGIIMGGGEDIHPQYYGKTHELNKCGRIDTYRDSLEVQLLIHAHRNRIPTLGICRGMQWLNVAHGGSLFTDLPSDIPSKINHSQLGKREVHLVKRRTKNSALFEAMGVPQIMVNSSHHQAIERLSPKFNAVGESPDGVIEAIEWKNLEDWFALGIQWHPERLFNDQSNQLLLLFLKELQKK